MNSVDNLAEAYWAEHHKGKLLTSESIISAFKAGYVTAEAKLFSSTTWHEVAHQAGEAALEMKTALSQLARDMEYLCEEIKKNNEAL